MIVLVCVCLTSCGNVTQRGIELTENCEYSIVDDDATVFEYYTANLKNREIHQPACDAKMDRIRNP